jgi:hypothetical protein
MTSLLIDSEYWRNRAEEARAIAGKLSDNTARATMERIADSYDHLARRAESRKAELAKKSMDGG